MSIDRQAVIRRSLTTWGAFAAFVVCAVTLEWHSQMLLLSGPAAPVKLAIWCAFLLFLGYSIYCSKRENLFKSVGSILELHWGRQIGIDLYIGVLIFASFMYWHEGSFMVVALWLLPLLLFANLAVLLYLAIHFEAIVARLAI